MAKEKVTITLDRMKAKRALALTSEALTSAVIDLALSRLIEAETVRRDIAGYRRFPPTSGEIGVASIADHSGLDDDIDWERLYSRD